MSDLPNEITKTLRVKAPPAVAFEVFTSMTTWWPMKTHHIGKTDPAGVLFEPHVGGRWYEKGTDGAECTLGRVLAWDPPGRLAFTWDISADFQPDPALQTEIEVLFVAESAEVTRVEFVHRKLDRYGEAQEKVLASIGGEGGWNSVLALFVKRVDGA